jgi:anti-sigma factor RsiW
MNCRQCSDDLTAYIDGELPDQMAEQIKVHLKECPPCDSEYRDLREAGVFIESHAGDVAPVPELWNNLRSRIAEMPPPTNSSGFFRFLVMNRWVAATATVGATVVLAIGIWSYMRYQDSQQELQSYMNQYLEQRSLMEQIHSQQIRRANYSPATIADREDIIVDNPFAVTGNPFAGMRPVSLDNPFQTEAR